MKKSYSVFVQMDALPHGTDELPDIAERVIVTRGGDEERASLRLPGRLREVGEEGRLWEGGCVRWSDDPAEWQSIIRSQFACML